MKRTIILFLLFFLFLKLSAQEFQFPKKTGGSSAGIPGTQIMVDMGEVAVSDWLSFLYNQYYDNQFWNSEISEFKEGYEKILPDTNQMPEKYRFMIRIFLRLKNLDPASTPFTLYDFPENNSDKGFWLPLTKEEYKSELKSQLFKFIELPIVGINYDQVREYLKWRTELANSNSKIIKTGYKVKARLMRKDEWVKYAVDLGPHFATNKTAQIDSVNEKGCYLLNVKVDRPCPSVLEGIKMFGEGAVAIWSYNQDNLGLYCMFGNIWEMTEEKGFAIGGSYKDYAKICNATNVITVTNAEQWLGFRCVLEFYK